MSERKDFEYVRFTNGRGVIDFVFFADTLEEDTWLILTAAWFGEVIAVVLIYLTDFFFFGVTPGETSYLAVANEPSYFASFWVSANYLFSLASFRT